MINLPPEFANTPWADFRSTDDPDLLITFSPVATPEGQFTPYRAIDSVPWNILRFNAPNAGWYVGGIPDTAHEIGLFERVLDEFTRQFRRVYVFGGSMGGFAAVDFGLRIRCDAVLSTGAETLMGHKDGFARWRATPESLATAHGRLAEWPALRRDALPALHLVYGAASPIDVLFAAEAQRLLGVEPILLRDCEHSVPIFAQKRRGFLPFMVNMLTTGCDDLVREYRVR